MGKMSVAAGAVPSKRRKKIWNCHKYYPRKQMVNRSLSEERGCRYYFYGRHVSEIFSEKTEDVRELSFMVF